MIRFTGILVLALVGSFITALAYAMMSSGKFEPHTLALPGVLQVALLYALVFGVLLAPVMNWSLKDKKLLIIVPFLFLIAIIMTVFLCYLDRRAGFIGAIVYWGSALIVLKFVGKRS